MRKTKKGYLQISFTWLFAIIAGAFILFLAIYGTTRLIRVERTALDAKTGKEIGVLLNPLETSFETGKTTSLILPVETRIYNKCSINGMFGKQIIQISQKSLKKWTETEVDVGFPNKYIFSEEYVEGKKFYIFSKPFDFPFKVANLLYITSSLDEYCFIGAPEEIENEISGLKQKNLLAENCSNSENIKICFSGNCDINVNYDYVEKDGERMYFNGDALMYAAIFSDPEVYECQLKRLMQRTRHLALLYRDKATFISQTGCYSNLNADLSILANSAKDFSISEDSSSADLSPINYIVEGIEEKNEGECRLW